MLQERDLGHRVVVRRRVGELFTDILGELVALDPEQLRVRTDSGTVIPIPRPEVFAAKPIPPRPPRYSEIAALELIADRAWPAPDRERLGEWLLRCADGWTNRANSALPLGDPGLPLADALAACVRWYQERRLTPKITVPLPLRRDLSRLLAERGWRQQPEVLVQVADVADIVARVPAAAVELTDAPSPEFLAMVGSNKGVLSGAALHVLTNPAQVRFAEVRGPAGAVAATGRGAVVDTWMHLGLVHVAPASRRQGLAQRVTATLASWAASAGAIRAVLQVEEHNVPAVSLYQRLGFRTHHRYRTYALPAGRS